MEPLTNFHLDLSEKLQLFIDGRLKNDMVKFLMNYIQMVERGQEFVFASRSQDWQLHLESCEKLAVDYHSTNRTKYMRMMPYYVASQYALQESDPPVWQALADGEFSVAKNDLPFTAIGVDHAGEQENKVLKVHGGLRGIANNENARNRFFVAAPIINRLCSELQERHHVPKQHHNLIPSQISKQAERVKRIRSTIEEHVNPFSSDDCGILRNMVTNAVVEEKFVQDIVNVTEKGKASLEAFENERLVKDPKTPLWATVSKNKISTFTSAFAKKNTKNTPEKNVKLERNLFAKFLIVSRSSRQIDEKQIIGNYELCDYPQSLMISNELIPCNDKYKLASALLELCESDEEVYQKNDAPKDIEIPATERCLILDGMAVVQSLVKVSWVKSCSDFAVLFNQKVEHYIKEQPFTEVRLVFDSYAPNSLKKATRLKRNQTCRSLYYRVEDSTNISDILFKESLSNEATKRELTAYLAAKFIVHFSRRNIKLFTVANNILRYVSGHDDVQHESSMVFNHDEADTMLIWHGIDFTESAELNAEIVIISPDTDVLVLCLYYAQDLCYETRMKTATKIFHIGKLHAALGPDRSKALLALHAISGCDTVGRFAGKGKLTWFNGLQRTEDETIIAALQNFGITPDLDDTDAENIAQFVSFVYTNKLMSLPDARWYLFTKKMAEGEKLPPTPSAFRQHLKRALLQAFEWKSSSLPTMVRCDPLQYGWIQDNEKWLPIASDQPSMSPDLLQLTKCKCKGKCNTRRCPCKGTTPSMECTEMCSCAETCENTDQDTVDGFDEEDDDDYGDFM